MKQKFIWQKLSLNGIICSPLLFGERERERERERVINDMKIEKTKFMGKGYSFGGRSHKRDIPLVEK